MCPECFTNAAGVLAGAATMGSMTVLFLKSWAGRHSSAPTHPADHTHEENGGDNDPARRISR
jgi:hypothetical protein